MTTQARAAFTETAPWRVVLVALTSLITLEPLPAPRGIEQPMRDVAEVSVSCWSTSDARVWARRLGHVGEPHTVAFDGRYVRYALTYRGWSVVITGADSMSLPTVTP